MTNVQDNSTTQTRATARHALRKLNSALAQRTDSTKGIDVAVEGSGEVIRLSQDVAGPLRDILANTAAGRSVSVIPTSAELTTQQAADLLNVSRPHVIKLMDDGVLEGHKVGTHRRLYASDVQAYKHQRDIKQRAAADELTALTDHLGLYE